MMVEIVEMALIPYYCCLLGVGTIFLGCLTTRGEPFSSENYRFQDNFLSSPSHAWNMRGPCTFEFGRSVFCVPTSGFSADEHCYIYPLNTSLPKHITTKLFFYIVQLCTGIAFTDLAHCTDLEH